MRLSAFTDYSLRVLMYAATKDGVLITTKETGEYFGISYHHLVKVVHRLSSLGLIQVQQGRGGGFRLAISPEKMKIGAIVRQMEPDLRLVECHSKTGNRCAISSFCRLKGELDQALQAFLQRLDQTTISDMIRDNREAWTKKSK